MQVGKEENFGDRLLLYWAKMYAATLEKGSDYGKLKTCISLAFVDFEMFPQYRDNPVFHYKFSVLERTLGFSLSNKLDMQVIELKKAPVPENEEDDKLMWLNFLKAKSEEEIAKMEQIGTMEMKMAASALRDFNADESNRIAAMNREIAEWARYVAMSEAEESGIQKAKLSAAKKALAKGIPPADVADFVELPIEDVNALING